jgi:hypothetical protein
MEWGFAISAQRNVKEKSTVKANDLQLLRAQSKAIAARRIMGRSIGQIAKEFQMHPDTVNSRMDWARRHGLVESALDTVIDSLVPEAIKTYLLAIQGGDVDASRDVLFGTGVLQRAPKTGQAPIESVEMTIETYRNSRKESVTANVSGSQTSRSLGPAPQHPSAQGDQGAFDHAALAPELGEDDGEDRGAGDGGGPVIDIQPTPRKGL